MEWREHLAQMESEDPEFRALREATRPQFEFRRALIAARIDAGLTQRAMAERLGVKQSALARWEAGATMPTLDTLFRLAQALNLEFSITPESPLLVRRREAA
jgi:HTH-type transcriptional regulator / antitoxin HipB